MMKNSNFMMELVIETLTGTTFELKVSPFETVLAVKAKIQRFEGIPIASQHLLYQDAELDEDSCLHDYGIKHGATLKLVLAMRGGPINTRRIPVEPERSELSSAGSKHVTLLVFREGDQLNFFRVVDRGDGTLTPLAESLSASSQHDSNGETDNLTSSTGGTVTVPCFLGTSDSDDEEVSGNFDDSKNVGGVSKAKANIEADHIRNKMRQLQIKMDHVKLSRKNWSRKAPRLQPEHMIGASDASHQQPHPLSETKSPGVRSVRYISSTAIGAASNSLGGVPLPQLPSQSSIAQMPPVSLPKMPPPEIIPLVSSSRGVYKLPSIVSSAVASSSIETSRLLSSRHRSQPSNLYTVAAASISTTPSGFEIQQQPQQPQMISAANVGSKSKKLRCHQCGKKTGIINSYSCRCGNNFCTRHRYAELHACVFDYKGEGRLQLHNANPLVQASKLPKI